MANRTLSVGCRVRNFQTFARATSSEDDRQLDSDIGIITYGEDGRYQVTSYRLGFRSDHAGDLLRSESDYLNVSDPLDRDREILLDEDSKGFMQIRREGDTVTKLDKAARKALDKQAKDEAAAHKAELERLQREHDAEIEKIKAERRAELEDEKRRVEATV